MALLDGLDAIDWTQLSHAYGPATDVPDLLRALVDPETAPESLRSNAKRAKHTIAEHVRSTLLNNVFHQGTVWSATPHVIPFLVEILRDGPDDESLREFLVAYLHQLALGHPADLFPAIIDPETYFAIADTKPDDPADPHSTPRLAGYARACYRAVEGALTDIAPFASDARVSVATAAIALLGSFRSDVAIDALREALRRHEGAPKAYALVALAQLDASSVCDAAEALASDPDRLIAVHAAVARILARPDDCPERIVELLTAVPGKLMNDASPFAETIGALVSRTLERLPPARTAIVVDALVASLPRAKGMAKLSVMYSLLRLVFPDEGAPESSADLSAPQRRVIESMLNYGEFGIGNFVLMLRDWGLPSERAALAAWLERDA
jgi:hypothetical protein